MSRPITWLYYADAVHALDGYGFVITEQRGHSLSLDVYEIEFEPLRSDRKFGASRVCSLYVKWDGCSHMSMHDAVGMHLCGARDWAESMDLIRRGAFTMAARHMERFNADEAGWVDDRPLGELTDPDLTREVEP